MMEHDSANYGLQREAVRYARPVGREVSRDERAWAALAHLSVFLNLITGFLGPVAALGIWLAHRGRSPVVVRHALRSAAYQAVWLAALAAGWAVTGILMVVLVGFLLVPVMVLASLGLFVHAGINAYRAYRGEGLDWP
ncbi:hypothetical protein RxyAA322_10120 [Rubrobacter xylanophilus]|uniref:DUF4870 domain-containing protein n=1 Tax=Rubrobacter xylanophilus TaxID=49319 RepID=A0A510HGX0_9ACTN|nr:DUF4870 domain-containing protein [Rubrobacter xylanophilus]BBL79158.1 hypothetical protein RxyAA322_10120 [Rubrobacter xylanophilus]